MKLDGSFYFSKFLMGVMVTVQESRKFFRNSREIFFQGKMYFKSIDNDPNFKIISYVFEEDENKNPWKIRNAIDLVEERKQIHSASFELLISEPIHAHPVVVFQNTQQITEFPIHSNKRRSHAVSAQSTSLLVVNQDS